MTPSENDSDAKELTPNERNKSAIAAAVARSLVKPFAFAYARPIKLFKPSALSSFVSIEARAKHRGIGLDTKNPFRRIYQVLEYNVQRSGYMGVLKQMLPPIVANSCTGFVTFGSYGFLISRCEHDLTFRHYFGAGVFSGLLQSFLVTPLDIARHRLQIEAQYSRHHTGIGHAIRDYYVLHGLAGLYRLWPFVAFRESLGMALFFTTYDTLRPFFISHVGFLAKSPQNDPNSPLSTGDDATSSDPQQCVAPAFIKPPFIAGGADRMSTEKTQALQAVGVALAGGLAGASYQLVAHPTDAMQAVAERSGDKAGMREMVARIRRKMRWKTVWRGLPASLAKAFSPSAIGFLVYEMALKKFND